MVALKHQPQILLARAALQAAHGKVLIAAQLLLPSVNINAGYLQSYQLNNPASNSNGTTSSKNNSGGFSSSIDVSQLIFDFGRTIDNVRENQALERSSGFGLTTAESDSAYAAKQAFYTYVQSLRDIDVAQANLNDSQGNLALAQARLSTGLGLPGDVVTAQTTVAQNTVSLLNAKNTAAQDQVSLALAMGIDPRTPLVPADSEERPLAADDTNALVDQALKQRPDVKQQEENLRAAGFAISYARKTLLPSVSLTAGISSAGPTQPFSNQFATYGVTLSWNPFDILNYRGQLDEAEAQRKTAEAEMQQTVQTVQSQVVQAYLNDKYAEQQVSVSTSELANATEGLRIAEGQYRAGTVTFVTVITAEANIATARGDLVNANAQLQLARAAMEHALGKPLG
jgi:outer membrane protein TolC